MAGMNGFGRNYLVDPWVLSTSGSQSTADFSLYPTWPFAHTGRALRHVDDSRDLAGRGMLFEYFEQF